MTLARLCEHGEMKPHGFPANDVRTHCPGGTVLDPDSLVIVKEDGEWPKWAKQAADPWEIFTASDGDSGFRPRDTAAILDALAAAQLGTET